MKKTPNYQLSQYEATDRVTREAFNADNAVIDAALAGIAAGNSLQTLKTITTTEAMTSVTLDVSDIDFSQWAEVHIAMELKGSGYWQPRFNTQSSSDPMNVAGHKRLILLPSHDGDMSVGGILLGYNVPKFTGAGSVLYNALTSFTLVSNSNANFQSGCKFTFFGRA